MLARPGAVFVLLLVLSGACSESGNENAPAVGSGASGGIAGGSTNGGGAGRASGNAGSGATGGSSAGTNGAAGRAVGGASATTGGTAGSSVTAGAGGAGSGGRAGAGRGGTSDTGGSSGAQAASGAAGTDDGEAGSSNAGLTSFRLVVIGSSTAAGEGASSSSKGWVSLLAASLEATVTNEFDADNLATGGYTTVELLPDSGASGSIDDALDRDPNLVILSLAGSNDLSAGTSTSTFLSRLETIEQHAVDAGVPIFFVSTAPKDLSTDEKETLRDWTDQMKDRFSSCWVPDQSSEYSPCFIDIFAPLANDELGVASEYSAGDGIHVNDAGHEVIFEAARAIVLPYICSMTECS